MTKKDSEINYLKEEVSSLNRNFKQILELNIKIIFDNKILKKNNEFLIKENKTLKTKIEKLTVKSNEPPGSKPDYLKSTSNKTDWKQSGQKKGHEGISRKNPEKIDKTDNYYAADTCHKCGSNDLKLGKVRTKIISELIFQTINIKELLHDKTCKQCKTKIKAISPNGESQSPYGRNLKTLFIYLRNVCGATLRPLETLFTKFFGLGITDSSISNNEIELSKLSKLKYESYLEEIKKENFSHKDETSWRAGGKLYWIWVYDSIKTIFYRLSDNRGKRTLIEDFGENPTQISINDCYAAYNLFKIIQICWAHIIRECKAHSLKEGATKSEKVFYGKICKIFKEAKEYKLKNESLAKRKIQRSNFESDLINLLISTNNKTEFLVRMCNRLDKQIKNTFLFVEERDIDPTNNLAERDLRPFVIHRKASFGSFSEAGGQAKVIFKTLFENAKREGLLFSEALNFLFENSKADLLFKK